MLLGLGRREYESRLSDTQGLDLFGQWLRMIDDVMGAKTAYPFLRLKSRSRGDHHHIAQCPHKLDGNGAHASRTADDEDCIGGTRNRPPYGAEKLAELFGPTLGGWSEERDAPLALPLVSPWA